MESNNNKLALKRLYNDNHILEEELKLFINKDVDNLERCSIMSKIISHKMENLLEISRIENERTKKSFNFKDFIKNLFNRFNFTENKK